MQVNLDVVEKVLSLEGEEVIIPIRISWKTEQAVLAKIHGLTDRIPGLIQFVKDAVRDPAAVDSGCVVDMLPEILNHAPECITSIVAILLCKDEQWVNNSLDSELIIKILTPFLSSISQRLIGKRGVGKAGKA